MANPVSLASLLAPETSVSGGSGTLSTDSQCSSELWGKQICPWCVSGGRLAKIAMKLKEMPESPKAHHTWFIALNGGGIGRRLCSIAFCAGHIVEPDCEVQILAHSVQCAKSWCVVWRMSKRISRETWLSPKGVAPSSPQCVCKVILTDYRLVVWYLPWA